MQECRDIANIDNLKWQRRALPAAPANEAPLLFDGVLLSSRGLGLKYRLGLLPRDEPAPLDTER